MKPGIHILFRGVILVLIGASLFFTFQVIRFKKGLNVNSGTLSLSSGEKVTVVKIIDGDEVSVLHGDNRFIVRMLGIRSFDPTINDPRLQNAGQLAFNFLEKNLLNRDVEIHFEKLKWDRKKRLLAHIFKEGKNIALEMVTRGMTLTYRRYPFNDLKKYLAEEEKARKKHNGFWSNPAAAQRAAILIQLWERQLEEESK